jgi:hypothetical protein
VRAGLEKNAEGPPQPITASAKYASVPTTTLKSFTGQDFKDQDIVAPC